MFRLRFFLTVILTLALSAPGSGQENVLLQYTNIHPVRKADSAAIIGLLSKSQNFEYKNMDTALAMVNEALRLSRKLNFNYGIGNSYIALSIYATTRGDYNASDSFLNKAYVYCVRSASPPGGVNLLVHWYETTSTHAAYRGEYSKSVNLACAALNLINQRPYDTTLTTARIRAYNAIGSMMQYLDRPEQAFYYLDKGIALAKAHNNKFYLAQLYVNYGITYNVLKKWPQAELYFHEAIKLSKEDSNTFVLQVAYLGMGSVYKDMGKNDTAITYLKLATQVSNKTNPYMATVTPHLLLGQVYFRKQDYSNSILYGESALAKSEILHAPQITTNAHALLANVYSATNQWHKAFTHQFAYTQLLDSIRNAKTMIEINQLEIKSRVAEKDKELSLQQLSLSQKETALREKNFWIAGASACALLLIALLLSARRNYRNKQKLQERTIELDRLKATIDGAEQERKRIAVELHDGIVSQLWGLKLNLTSTINKQQQAGPLRSGDFKQSLDYLDDAMNDLRHTAHNLSPEMALQSGLPKALADFCHKMNNQGETDVHFQIYGQAQPTDKSAALSIFRAVQELVQNALKHAKASTVLVQLNCEEDITGITVQDDGAGFDITGQKRETGMGLHNVTDRIHALKGEIDIHSNGAGTSIYMEFKNKDIEDIKI